MVAFSGRVLAGDEKTAKYVNSPETPIFTKGKVFFGLDKSKRPILDAGFAIVCEGQLDLIACYMGGVRNIVAPQGTAFTPEHARILKRYVDEVVLCFDSDNAGQNAASRALDGLLAAGLAVRVATVPSPHDPDSFIKEFGGPAFQDLITRAEGFFDFYLNRLCATNDAGSDMGRMNIVRSMGEAVLKTGSAVLVDTYSQKTAQRLGVSAESVRVEFGKAPQTRRADEPSGPQPQAPATITPPAEREFWLMRYVLSSDDHDLHSVSSNLDLSWVTHGLVREVIGARLAAQQDGTWRGIPSLLETMQDPVAQSLIASAVAIEFPKQELVRQISENIRMLRNDFCDRELAALTRRLGQPGLSHEELVSIELRKRELRTLKQSPMVESPPSAQITPRQGNRRLQWNNFRAQNLAAVFGGAKFQWLWYFHHWPLRGKLPTNGCGRCHSRQHRFGASRFPFLEAARIWRRAATALIHRICCLGCERHPRPVHRLAPDQSRRLPRPADPAALGGGCPCCGRRLGGPVDQRNQRCPGDYLFLLGRHLFRLPPL